MNRIFSEQGQEFISLKIYEELKKRNEELERELASYKPILRFIENERALNLKEKNTLLAALKFYADKSNYQGSPSRIDMQDNCGMLARFTIIDLSERERDT